VQPATFGEATKTRSPILPFSPVSRNSSTQANVASYLQIGLKVFCGLLAFGFLESGVFVVFEGFVYRRFV
jgi:hypothetical protein